MILIFFFNDTATSEIYTLSLHDALPILVGFKLTGKLREGVTATDLVLTVTQMLRKKGVVGKFVEFYGPGLNDMTVADRATIGNRSEEHTSELQSRQYLVCRLLLEKKNKT